MLFTGKNCSWHGMMSHRDSKFASNNTSTATVFTPESLKKLFEQLKWRRRTETRSCLYLVSQKRTGWSRPLASFFSSWVRTEQPRVEAVNRIGEKNSTAQASAGFFGQVWPNGHPWLRQGWPFLKQGWP